MIYILPTSNCGNLRGIDKINPIKNLIEPWTRAVYFFDDLKIPVTFFVNCREIRQYEQIDNYVYDQLKTLLSWSIDQGNDDIQFLFSADWHHYQWQDGKWMDDREGKEDEENKDSISINVDLKPYADQIREDFLWLKEICPRVVAFRSHRYELHPVTVNFPLLLNIEREKPENIKGAIPARKRGFEIDSSIVDEWKPFLKVFPFGYATMIEFPIIELNFRKCSMSGSVEEIWTIFDVIKKYEKQSVQENKDIFITLTGNIDDIGYAETKKMLKKLRRTYHLNFWRRLLAFLQNKSLEGNIKFLTIFEAWKLVKGQ